MLRPSQGSILSSSRAAQRRTARKERARAASGALTLVAVLLIELLAGVLELLLLLFLPLAYVAAAFLTLSLPARLLFGSASLTLAGAVAFLLSLSVSAVGLVRASQGSEPVAPVSRGFARLMLALCWGLAMLLVLGDL